MKEQIFYASVGELVADDYRRSEVFTGYGIDYSCGGNISLKEACESKGLDPSKVWNELNRTLDSEPSIDYLSFSPVQLIQHVVDVHHTYVRNSVIPLKAYLEKLVRTEAVGQAELMEIKELFFRVCDHLYSHMEKEEMILFPYLKAMYGAIEKGYPLSMPYFKHVDNPISELEENHRVQMDSFNAIRKLSNNYKTHSHSSRTLKVAYAMLEEFEQNFRLHIHLENNIIFPGAQSAFDRLAERAQLK